MKTIISNCIPQREPMMMVDTLISHDEKETISSFTILKDNVFVENEIFSEAGLLENMAQTAALGKGYEYGQNNEKPPIGFIGAVKNFEVFGLPHQLDTIETKATIKYQVLNASIVEAQVYVKNIKLAACELKIFINPDIS